METLKRQISINRWYLILCLAFLLVGGVVLIIVPKPAIHLFLNSFCSSAADTFFAMYTFLGDGVASVALVVVLLFVRYRLALGVAISNILCGLTTQALKHFVFTDALRPWAYFEGRAQLHLAPGVEALNDSSFPSGHAAVAFATCWVLSLATQRRSLKVLCFVVALSVAYSRVYLSQHFLGDIYAGAVLGIAAGMAVTLFTEKKWGRDGIWLDRSFRGHRNL